MPIKRLPGHDYATAGAYFFTICTHRRRLLFVDSPAVDQVEVCWSAIPDHFAVEPDAFVVMPNHVHGILWLPRAGHARPLQVVVGSFKSAVSRALHRARSTDERVWQRGYFDRVIRDEHELERLREYIVSNPATWDADPMNPRATSVATVPWL